VVVSCRCGDVQLRQGELLPGETTELSVSWDLRGRSGETKETLAILYVLDDDEQQFLSVGLRANVISSPG